MLVRTWPAWLRSEIVFWSNGLRLYCPAGNVCVPTLKTNGILSSGGGLVGHGGLYYMGMALLADERDQPWKLTDHAERSTV